jgi:excisionase family DNA binding protein
MERLLLKPAEFAEAIGVSRSRGYELIQRGEVPSIRIGASVRVPVDALKAWIEDRMNGRQHQVTVA